MQSTSISLFLRLKYFFRTPRFDSLSLVLYSSELYHQMSESPQFFLIILTLSFQLYYFFNTLKNETYLILDLRLKKILLYTNLNILN